MDRLLNLFAGIGALWFLSVVWTDTGYEVHETGPALKIGISIACVGIAIWSFLSL